MRRTLFFLLLLLSALPSAIALEKQPLTVYQQRRHALAERLNGGFALLFAAEEPQLDFDPYRQGPDFYYLTGWTEPGAALLIAPAVDATSGHAAQTYLEVLFLPERNMRMERYTGAKIDAASAHVSDLTGVGEVAPLTSFAEVVIHKILTNRRRFYQGYTQLDSGQAVSSLASVATALGMDKAPAFQDVHDQIMPLRAIKDSGEIDLLRKAANASIAAQFAMMKAMRPGVTERTIAGVGIATMMAGGCERPSYASIVGSGPNSTTLHYSENGRIIEAGDVIVIDEAGEYSMYASDITRTLPASGHFSDRQREIYNIVLGSQRAAAAAFVASKSMINDPEHHHPESLDQAAFDYINTHGRDLHGQPLGKYFIHGLGHSVGIDVHDPLDYNKPLEKGMVFTIEPGIYIPEEHIGVRIEDVFYARPDGTLEDLIATLPHTAEDVEAAMKK